MYYSSWRTDVCEFLSRLEREKEEDDERAESEAEGKEALALTDEEHLRANAASLEELAGTHTHSHARTHASTHAHTHIAKAI